MMVLPDFINSWYGVNKKEEIKKIEEEVVRYCPICHIEVRKNVYGDFTHEVYKLMYLCILQWDQLISLPRK